MTYGISMSCLIGIEKKKTMVVIEIEGIAATVPADDLRRAIHNATNHP